MPLFDEIPLPRELKPPRNEYNESRPHMSLGYMTPQEYSAVMSKNKAGDSHLDWY